MDCDFTPISKKQTWAPEFKDGTKHLYLIDGFEPIRECPVSAITAEAREAVMQWERIEFARGATGTCWEGPKLSDWAPHSVEISIALASEQNRLENSKMRSEATHTRRTDKTAEQGEG